MEKKNTAQRSLSPILRKRVQTSGQWCWCPPPAPQGAKNMEGPRRLLKYRKKSTRPHPPDYKAVVFFSSFFIPPFLLTFLRLYITQMEGTRERFQINGKHGGWKPNETPARLQLESWRPIKKPKRSTQAQKQTNKKHFHTSLGLQVYKGSPVSARSKATSVDSTDSYLAD